jgi:imidazolonepropionase-like amidohydrolase
MLSQTGGHGDKRGVLRDAPLPRNSLGVFPQICDGADAVRKAAREVLRKGADQVKVMASGGVASPSDKAEQWQFTIDELRAAVETAEAAGTYVMAHAYGPTAIKNCIDAGVHSIEHGNLLDRQIADLMAEKGVYYVPTLSVYAVLTGEEQNIKLDPFVCEKLKKVADVALNALELAHKAGVKIGSGSDLIGPFQHLKGKELSIKAEVMSPMEAIVSATRTNAELFGMSDAIGTLETGKEADLIVVDGNPLDDLSLFDQGGDTIRLVMKKGQIMKDLL